MLQHEDKLSSDYAQEEVSSNKCRILAVLFVIGWEDTKHWLGQTIEKGNVYRSLQTIEFKQLTNELNCCQCLHLFERKVELIVEQKICNFSVFIFLQIVSEQINILNQIIRNSFIILKLQISFR